MRALAILVAVTRIAAADRRLSDEDLARKQERGYVTAVPLAAYSVDFGYGAGARAYYYWNGTRDDPRFVRTPYLLRTFVNAFATTRGLQYHWLDVDAPELGRTPYRLRGQLILQRDPGANYFGFSEAAREALRFPGSPETFESYSTYDAAQRATGYAHYDDYDLLRPAAILLVERALLEGRVRLLAGLGFEYARIRDTSTADVPSRLAEDCAAGVLVGCAGGRDHEVKLGITYDTRDFEPDPNRGVHAELSVDLGTAAIGSEYDYARALLAVRGYHSPLAGHDVVLAGRVLLQVQSRGTPFFTMDVLPFVEDPRTGLGGHRTIRGFRQSRFVDHVMAAASGELRWTFARTTVLRQKLAFIAVPFVDVGRAFDELADVGVDDWRPAAGAALRISWNLATIGTFEYGRAAEGTGVYFNFGHMF